MRTHPTLDARSLAMHRQRIVAQGVDACLAVALEESEHATALRQSSPFTGILTHQERFAFLRQWRDRQEA